MQTRGGNDSSLNLFGYPTYHIGLTLIANFWKSLSPIIVSPICTAVDFRYNFSTIFIKCCSIIGCSNAYDVLFLQIFMRGITDIIVTVLRFFPNLIISTRCPIIVDWN